MGITESVAIHKLFGKVVRRKKSAFRYKKIRFMDFFKYWIEATIFP